LRSGTSPETRAANGSIGGIGGSALRATPDARRLVEPDRVERVLRVESVAVEAEIGPAVAVEAPAVVRPAAVEAAPAEPSGASPQSVQ